MRRFALFLLILLSVPVLAEDRTVDDFESLLRETELNFTPPDGYADLKPAANPVLDYERALRSPDGALEIRLAIRPLKRLRIEYDDPHGSVPDPNHIFPLMFESLASQLAGGRHAPSNVYSPQDARKRYNAGWAAAAVFDVNARFSERYFQGLLLALHRNKVSDAYVVYLFDDYARVKDLIREAMRALVFVDFDG